MKKLKDNPYVKRCLKKPYIAVPCLIILVLILYQFAKFFIEEKNAFYIGIVLPLEGPDKSTGENLLQMLEMFKDQVNKTQDLSGKLKYVVVNEAVPPDIARKNAKTLIENKKIIGIIGYFYSNNLKNVADIYENARMPVISLTASTQLIENNDYLFSMCARNTKQAACIAVYLKKVLKIENISIICGEDLYCRELLKAFNAKSKRIDLTINNKISVNMDKPIAPDFIKNLVKEKRIGRKTTGIVLLSSYFDPAIDIIKQLRDNDLDFPIIGPGALHADFPQKNAIISNNPEYMKNVYAVSHFVTDLANEKVVYLNKKVEDRCGVRPYRDSPFCYEAAQYFCFALSKAGANRNKIHKYLKAIDINNPLDLATGNSYFDKKGFKNNHLYFLKIYKGEFQPAFTQLIHVKEPDQADNMITIDGETFCIVDIVIVGMDFFRINDIDTKNMNFDAELFLWYKWKGEKVDISQIDIVNGIYGVTDKTTLIQKDLSKPVKYVCYRIKGTFLKPFELAEFPFDMQILPIVVAHRTKDSRKLMLIMDAQHKFRPLTEIYPREWKYIGRRDYSGLCEYNTSFGIPDYRKQDKGAKLFSSVESVIGVQRIPNNYILTIFIPLSIIIAIAIILFFVPINHFDTRLSTAMTALLSLVVFQMSIRSSLPKVGYLLKADIYFLVAYILIFTSIINIVGLNVLLRNAKEKLAKTINIIFCLIFIIFTLVIYTILTVR